MRYIPKTAPNGVTLEQPTLGITEEINEAIDTHDMWKIMLRGAINSGTSRSTPEQTKQDTNCTLGKWLHERIDSEAKQSPHYAEIVDLHAKFHQQAGAILELALNGNPDKAHNLMGVSQPFARYSALLTLKLKEWKGGL